ncbi:MAG: SGNH/GDSL hydrolase family protein [Acidobacteriaceae bacterium]|nr:SGNH/GDSL hydrolase family protein [Acidobacteriaceae bacterium]
MHAKFLAITGIVLISPFCAAVALPLTSINQLIVFGDSLSDNGNAATVLGPLWPANYAPNALTDGTNTTPPIPTGGPQGLWIDQLAPKLGLPDPQPYLLGGTNFAAASAVTGSSSLQDIGSQIGIFSAAHLGSAPSNALYVIWGGANDVFNNASNPSPAASQAVANLFADILTLKSEGAKYFLWLDLPPLGNTPRGNALNDVSALNTASALFDSTWKTDLGTLQSQGLQIVGVDINQLYSMIASNPSLYGFTDITDPAQGLAGVNPDNYLFWDDQHPTTAGDTAIAQFAYNNIVGTAAVPEPAAAGLLLIGLGCVLRFYRHRTEKRPS